MWVQWRFIGLLWLVESELVVVAVLGSIQLLDQKHNGVMDDSQHPQAVHTWNRKQNTTKPCWQGRPRAGDSSQLDAARCWPVAAAFLVSFSHVTGKELSLRMGLDPKLLTDLFAPMQSEVWYRGSWP